MLLTADRNVLTDDIYRYYQDTFIEKNFQGVGGVQLRYIQQKSTAEADDALILLGGRTEFAEKYAEVLFDLRHLNITIYSYDHRGQGLSERLLGEYNKGYVDRFDDYSEDLELFIEKVVSAAQHKRLFVLCHSMGGAVAAQFHHKYPGILDGIIFSAPMFGINTSPVSPIFAEYIVGMMIKLGYGERYIFKGRPDAWKIKFAGNPLTSDRHRFERNLRFLENNPLLELGSPTFKWLKESMAVGRELLVHSGDGSLTDIPMVVLQGERDRVVSAIAHKQFSRQIPSCSLHVIKGAKHELLMEQDDKRNQVLSLITDFLKEYSSA